MISANLLPPEIKDEIEQTKKNRVSLRFAVYAFLILILVGGIFVGGYIYFSRELKTNQAELIAKQQVNDKYGTVTEKAKSLAAKVNAIRSIDDNTYKWSGIITEIQKVMPSGAYLVSVKIDSDKKIRGQITGYASNKQIVASLRDSLENSSKFEFVDIESSKTQTDPTTQKDEENFTLTFSLEKGALK